MKIYTEIISSCIMCPYLRVNPAKCLKLREVFPDDFARVMRCEIYVKCSLRDYPCTFDNNCAENYESEV